MPGRGASLEAIDEVFQKTYNGMPPLEDAFVEAKGAASTSESCSLQYV